MPFTTNYSYEHAEWIAPGNFLIRSGILIHTLELKISHFKCFPISLYREAMRLQCFLPTRYVRGGATHAYKCDDESHAFAMFSTHAHNNVTTITNFGQI